MATTVEEPSASDRWQRLRHSTDGAAGTAHGPVSRDLAASVLPPQMLHEDELILLLLKPSLWFILITSLRFILAITLVGVFVARVFGTSTAVTPQQVAIVTTLLCLGRLVWALLVWTSHVYLLTNQRIVTIKGVINVSIYQAHLRKIQRTTLYRPWYLLFLGLGTIGFATAATETFDSTWLMLGHPIDAHETVVRTIRRMQGQ